MVPFLNPTVFLASFLLTLIPASKFQNKNFDSKSKIRSRNYFKPSDIKTTKLGLPGKEIAGSYASRSFFSRLKSMGIKKKIDQLALLNQSEGDVQEGLAVFASKKKLSSLQNKSFINFSNVMDKCELMNMPFRDPRIIEESSSTQELNQPFQNASILSCTKKSSSGLAEEKKLIDKSDGLLQDPRYKTKVGLSPPNKGQTSLGRKVPNHQHLTASRDKIKNTEKKLSRGRNKNVSLKKILSKNNDYNIKVDLEVHRNNSCEKIRNPCEGLTLQEPGCDNSKISLYKIEARLLRKLDESKRSKQSSTIQTEVRSASNIKLKKSKKHIFTLGREYSPVKEKSSMPIPNT
ncbi:unnamed protein product [Moneuplotes crassus]|uniref:Uncharacterized protein n=1 Tax=Euplotes crassus TaxID=5936 RepID=A0AAD2DB35_EUPCR|nr:unnamed protein product [Moneuplotes crassus]